MKKTFFLKRFFILLFLILSFITIIMSSKTQSYPSNLTDEEDVITMEEEKKTEKLLKENKLVKITSLCYHEVNDTGDPLAVSTNDFRTHLKEFKAAGYTFINLSDLKKITDGKMDLPNKPLFISFDDGYQDNYINAYNILLSEGGKATFFVVSNNIDKPNRLSSDEIKQMLANGMSIGSHTVNHNNLTDLSPAQIDYELAESQNVLKTKFNTDVSGIAYPEGYVNNVVLDLSEKYYDFGFLAKTDTSIKETSLTMYRYGVFRWNHHIKSIFLNKQK